MPRKILIVDDNADLVDLLQAEFASVGFEVLCAPSGAQALQAIERENHFDLILLDVRMPEMSGQQFLDLLEETNPAVLREVPIVFSSAGAPPVDPRVTGFIDKMTDLPDFLSQIRSFLAPLAPPPPLVS